VEIDQFVGLEGRLEVFDLMRQLLYSLHKRWPAKMLSKFFAAKQSGCFDLNIDIL